MNTAQTLARAARAALESIAGDEWRGEVIQRYWDEHGAPNVPPVRLPGCGPHEVGWDMGGGQMLTLDWLQEARARALSAARAAGAQVIDGTPVPYMASMTAISEDRFEELSSAARVLGEAPLATSEWAHIDYRTWPVAIILPGDRRVENAAQIHEFFEGDSGLIIDGTIDWTPIDPRQAPGPDIDEEN